MDVLEEKALEREVERQVGSRDLFQLGPRSRRRQVQGEGEEGS